jgi:tRNA-specific 2-thiouridylase
MSGGVDSSVAAAVLKEQGREVVGIGLKLVDPAGQSLSGRSCCGIRDMEDARRVAEHIGVPFYVLNFTEEFRESVIDYFTASYLRGETPNPCVHCNEVIKFDMLLRRALGLEAEFLATGHYARAERDSRTGRYVLRKGIDGSKDQSYFLYSLSQEQLSCALFPVGGMSKEQVRGVARSLGLKVHDKTESQDVCFVGSEGYAAFVRRSADSEAPPGPILDESGNEIGRHRGLLDYTIGQRRGLGLSTAGAMYVIDIDPAGNSITVAPGDRLARQSRLVLDRVNYVSIARPEEEIPVEAVTRYRREAVPAILRPMGEVGASLEFEAPQDPTAPGQSVVLYEGDRVLCGGVAKRAAGK